MQTNKSTQLIDAKFIQQNLSTALTMQIMEEAYLNLSGGVDHNPPKASIIPPSHGNTVHFINSMPIYLASQEIVGIKWVSVMNNNPTLGLPTTMGTIILNDPQTGYPLAILDGTYITHLRSGLSAAIGAKYLATPLATEITIIGPGQLAQYALNGIMTFCHNLRQVNIIGRNPNKINEFITQYKQRYPDIIFNGAKTLTENLENSDLVIVATSSPTPVIQGLVKLKFGCVICHLSAFDFSIDLLADTTQLVFDHTEYAQHRLEEVNHIDLDCWQIPTSDIGQIIANPDTAVKNSARTIYYSIGLAATDIAIANYVYQLAQEYNYQPTLQLYNI